ncbi:hypothetical protein SLU01_01650 [Sporosarcina luteola]|uniref:Uncharacterized protein n=1 Tax=Sporosarcina luteola TaxID=582850 RepID=A0A511Z328_9BACL|nr:hypothetical protein [Sporosarcina luteola]GEN81853.1 hypothetical protein SLU01_01650 [Sporosarcina luteola]
MGKNTFFSMSKYKLVSMIIIIIVSIISLSSYMYSTVNNGTTLMNWFLVGVMLLVFVVMVIENIITKNDK